MVVMRSLILSPSHNSNETQAGRLNHSRHRTKHNVAVDDVVRIHESEERYENGLKVLANELRALGMALEVHSSPGSRPRISIAPV
jgi:hypothetical protein